MLLYIIGAHYGEDDFDDNDYWVIEEKASIMGWDNIFYPHIISTNLPDRQAMAINFSILSHADAVYVLKSGRESEKARAESAYALAAQIPIAYDLCDLAKIYRAASPQQTIEWEQIYTTLKD